MTKKSFQTAPKPVNSQLSQVDIEAFERGGAGHDKNPQNLKPANVGVREPVKTKRLSVDLPEETHLRFKTTCAANGLKMTRELETMILARCQELENK